MANKKNLISLFSEPISKTYWLRCKHQNLWLQRKLSCFLRKERILRYLCVLDSKLSWTHHITYISTKISKSLGILARLRYFVLSSTLLNIYRSLVEPYLPYGIEKILILQQRALRLIHLKPFRFHAGSNCLMSFLYFKTICLIVHDGFSNVTAPNVSNLFTYSPKVHYNDTRFSAAGNFYMNPFAPGDFAEKRVLKLVEWFSGHCRAIKS